MIHFYHRNLTTRWKYVLDFVFGSRGINYSLCERLEEDTFNLPGLISIDPTVDGRFSLMFSSTLLEEDKIRTVKLDGTSDAPLLNGEVDFFGSIFFVLTQYEQYLSSQRDSLGRFPASESILKRKGWLHQPIADRWSERIIENIEAHFGFSLRRKEKSVQLVPTFDIDNAYAFKGKGILRNCLSMARDGLRLDGNRFIKRIAWSLGLAKDPYDTYVFIRAIAKEFPVHVFWLTESTGGKDNNLSIRSGEVQEILASLKEDLVLGLHPSFASNFGENKIQEEKKNLEEATKSSIEHARMHFLRLELPGTYRSFLKAGIKEDHSLGFADEIGFRIGTARKISWFDLGKNEVTPLQLQPFVYMDGSLNEYMKLSPLEAKNKVTELYREVEKYGGDFVFLWHNETISDFGKWKGWSAVLIHTLELGENGK